MIASPRSLSERVPSPDAFRKSVISISVGTDHPFDALLRRLDDYNFERRDFVGGYGEYSVRGGIVDIFPYSGDNPIRVEFWGDRVESIREFDPMSQRSIRELTSTSVVPNISEATRGDTPDQASGPGASACHRARNAGLALRVLRIVFADTLMTREASSAKPREPTSGRTPRSQSGVSRSTAGDIPAELTVPLTVPATQLSGKPACPPLRIRE